MSDNVVKGNFGSSPFPLMAEIEETVWAAIMEFEGRVPTMGVVGILRLIEHRLLSDLHQ